MAYNKQVNNNNKKKNKNNYYYLSRVTPSVARTVINKGPDVQIELELILQPGEKPSEQSENQQQTQPTCSYYIPFKSKAPVSQVMDELHCNSEGCTS